MTPSTRLRLWLQYHFSGDNLAPSIIIAINVLVWLASITVGGLNPFSPSPAQLGEWGGNFALATFTGEGWRLFTSVFMHAGILHLFMNMLLLQSIGAMTVQRFGRWGFVQLYLLGGLLASAASAWWQSHTLISTRTGANVGALGLAQPALNLIVSVGASGAIFAVCGALLAVIVRAKITGNWMYGFDVATKNALLRVVGINIAIGFMIKGIDQSAHVGGLLAGLLLGLVLPIVAMRQTRARKLAGYALACLLAAGLLGLAFATANYTQLQQVNELFEQHTTQP